MKNSMLDLTRIYLGRKINKPLTTADNCNSKEFKKNMKQKELLIKFTKVRDTSRVPEYKTPGAAACDLYADFPEESWTMTPYTTILVPTGIKMEIPEGYVGMVVPRSGLSLKAPIRIANAPGIIDSDFRGEIQIVLSNIGAGVFTIKRGERLAQILFVKTETAKFKEVKSLSETKRGEGGFGSTGIEK